MILVLTPSCERVPKPASDATPPSIMWKVSHRATGEQVDHAATATINASRGERYQVILEARDPEGLERIEINPAIGSGEARWQCVSGDIGQSKSATLASQAQPFTPSADDTVPTGSLLVWDVNLAMPCGDSYTFAGGSYTLTGRASNWGGGSTTGTLTFRVDP
jgi:hypothetical protein